MLRLYTLKPQARKMPPPLKLLLLLLLSGSLLTGCNTARGVGEDIQSLGHAISHAVS